MRFLIVARLSHSTAASTSIDRQLATCRAEVEKLGGSVVGTAIDDDVSGITVKPEDRPSLGPWLTGERAPMYDALIVYRVDRLARSVFDLHRIARWLKEHEIALVSATEPIDTSTATGRMSLTMLGLVAEMEGDAITERIRSYRARRLREPLWAAGNPPYGWELIPAPGGRGKRLAPHPDRADVVRQMVADYLGGAGFAQIADELNAAGTPTSYETLKGKRARWTATAIKRILVSPALLGVKVRQDKTPVLDDDGRPVVLSDAPLIDAETFRKLAAEVGRRTLDRPAAKNQTALLSGVIECWHCHKPMHSQVQRFDSGRRVYRSYVCPRADRHADGRPVRVRAGAIEEAFSAAIVESMGARPIEERRWNPGSSNAAEIADIDKRILSVRADYESGMFEAPEDREWLTGVLTRLRARRAELEAEPVQPSGWSWTDTGRLWRDEWSAAADDVQRNRLLRAAGVLVWADRSDAEIYFDAAPDSDVFAAGDAVEITY